MLIDEAAKLENGARVRDTNTGALGEVVPSGVGFLTVRWVEHLRYDRELRDYIASTTWDLLDLDAPDDRDIPLASISLEAI